MYRQRVDGYDLSIERGTPSVPADGYYYVILRGEQRGRFRSLAQATRLYAQLKAEMGYQAPPAAPSPSADELHRRHMDAQSNKSLLWTDEDYARVDRKTRGRPKHGGGRP